MSLPVDIRTNIEPDAGGWFGRDDDEKLASELVNGSQLVTIFGAPGAGKTRLARRVARRVAEAKPPDGGAWFCDLSSTRSDSEVDQRIAFSLELGDAKQALTPDVIGRLLHARGDMVVVLDNAEHVLDALATRLARWVETAPLVHFIVTSREALNIAAEHRVSLLGLGLEPAIALMRDRAGSHVEDSASLRSLAATLDGLPLALELAGARLQTSSADQISAELKAGKLGESGVGKTTLAATVDWSLELLSNEEREFLGAISVFPFAFHLSWAESVSGRADGVALLAKLIAKSLVMRERDAFRLYAVVRERAVKLSDPELHASMTLRFARHMVSVGESIVASMPSDGTTAVGELDRAFLSLWHAFDALADANEWNLASRLALAMEAIIDARGPADHYARMLKRCMDAHNSDEVDSVFVRLLTNYGYALRVLGKLDLSIEQHERAIRIARLLVAKEPSDTSALVNVLQMLALSQQLDKRRPAADLMKEALAHVANANIETQRCLYISAAVFAAGTNDLAGVERNVVAAKATGITPRNRFAPVMTTCEASLPHAVGDIRKAETLLRDAVRSARAMKYCVSEAQALRGLAMCAVQRGADLDAEQHLLDAIRTLEESGQDVSAVGIRVLLAGLYLRSRRLRNAHDVAIEATRLAERSGVQYLQARAGALRIAIGHALHAEPDSLERFDAQVATVDATHARSADALRVLRALFTGSIETSLLEDAKKAQPIAPETAIMVASVMGYLRPATAEKPVRLRIAPRCLSVQLDEESTIDLSSRSALRRIVAALVDARLSSLGRPLSVADLVARGWPEDPIGPKTGANRVYVAVNTLRTMGLDKVIIRNDDGYLLDPDVGIELSSDP